VIEKLTPQVLQELLARLRPVIDLLDDMTPEIRAHATAQVVMLLYICTGESAK